MSECWHYIRFGTISDGIITGMHCTINLLKWFPYIPSAPLVLPHHDDGDDDDGDDEDGHPHADRDRHYRPRVRQTVRLFVFGFRRLDSVL